MDAKTKVPDGFSQVTITNTAAGARGIFAREGLVILEPGERRPNMIVADNELDDLPEHFFEGDKPKAPVETRTPSEIRQARNEERAKELEAAESVKPIELTKAETRSAIDEAAKIKGSALTPDEEKAAIEQALAAKQAG